MSMKNPSDYIENQSRDLPTSCTVPNVGTYGRKTYNTSQSVRCALYSNTYINPLTPNEIPSAICSHY